QKVKTGDYVGRVGRTGNANTTHLHFAIYRNGVVVEIPGIKHGDWVQQGDVIPGNYPELSSINAVRGSYVVKSLFAQSGYDVPGTSARAKGSFAKGKLFRIKAAKKGSFQAESGEWIPMGGIITGGFNLY